MTRTEAIKIIDVGKKFAYDEKYVEAFDTAIEALEQISHLKGRPCEVCEYHTENGCSKWECVFKGV